MIKVFSFDVAERKSSRDDLYLYEGKAFGLFLVSPFHKKMIYGNRSEYADRDLEELKWWHKIIYRKKINQYQAYRKGEYRLSEGDGWAGFRPLCLRFPIRFIVKVTKTLTIYEKQEHVRICYTYQNSEYEKSIIKTTLSKYTLIGRS